MPVTAHDRSFRADEDVGVAAVATAETEAARAYRSWANHRRGDVVRGGMV